VTEEHARHRPFFSVPSWWWRGCGHEAGVSHAVGVLPLLVIHSP
jgi:hypothetical protein